MPITYNSGNKSLYTSTASVMYRDRRKFNLGDKVAELVPQATPFLSLLRRLPKEQVDDPDYKFLEHRAHWLDNLTYSVSAATTITSVSAGSSADIKVKITNNPTTTILAGHIIQVVDADDHSKYANILVSSTSLDSTNSLVKVTGTMITNTPGFNAAKNDQVQRIGSAFEDGSAKASGYSDNLESVWASAQIFKTKYGIDNTLRNTRTFGGGEYARIRADKMKEHLIEQERAFIFGQRYGSSKGNPFSAPGAAALLGSSAPNRTSHGIINATIYGAANNGIGGAREFNKTKASYTFNDFMDDMEEVYEYDSSVRKFSICGRGVMTFFTKLARAENDISMTQAENKLGLKIMRLETPSGDLDLVYDPLLRGSVYKNFMVNIDPANVGLMIFRDTQWETNIQTPGTDAVEEQYLSQIGLIVKLPETHSVFRFSD